MTNPTASPSTASRSEPRIAELLPHSGRMLLLDELLEQRPDGVIAGLTIRRSSPFWNGSGVPSWVGMEYMAQAACAFSGLELRAAGKPPAISLLLGMRQYLALVPEFAEGLQLRVHATLVLRGEDDLAAFDCRICAADAELARGDIKALRPADLAALLARRP